MCYVGSCCFKIKSGWYIGHELARLRAGAEPTPSQGWWCKISEQISNFKSENGGVKSPFQPAYLNASQRPFSYRRWA